MKTLPTLIALAAITAMSACQKPSVPATEKTAAAPITEGEAATLADNMVTVWESADAAKIKALYAPGVVAFDYAIAGLPANRADFDKRQDAFVAFKIDKEEQLERQIQILDADTFIVSGTWRGSSTALPANNGDVRCTDVFEKADGNWSIVNEHCSAVPKSA